MTKVKILEHFHAYGPAFENLKPGAIVEPVKAPTGQKHLSGIWVMGVGEPVRLLPGEFKLVEV